MRQASAAVRAATSRMPEGRVPSGRVPSGRGLKGRGVKGPQSKGRARPVAALGVAVLAGLAGCTSSGSGGGGGISFISGDGTVTFVPPAKRGQPVSLAGGTLDGGRADAASFRGQPVVVNVWGSWCAPCRKEAPDLQAAYQQLKESGVGFIGIDTRDDDPAQALAFQRTFGITYPSIVDNGGSVLLSLRGAVAPQSVPSTLVLDAQGRVAARVSGPVDRTTLVGLVSDVRGGTTPKA